MLEPLWDNVLTRSVARRLEARDNRLRGTDSRLRRLVLDREFAG